MNTGGARLLRDSRNEFLNFFAYHHHHIGELIDYDDDTRQRLELTCRLLLIQQHGVVSPEWIEYRCSRFLSVNHLLVVAGEVTNAEC